MKIESQTVECGPHTARLKAIEELVIRTMHVIPAAVPGLCWRAKPNMGDEYHVQIWIYGRRDVNPTVCQINLASENDEPVVAMLQKCVIVLGERLIAADAEKEAALQRAVEDQEPPKRKLYVPS
jgi:hypothetical protein